MRIQKTSETRALAGNIVNEYNDSQTSAYSTEYINDLNTYSTTEQRIGTWIDGKPIYRKTFTGSNGGNSSITISSSINNIGNIIDIKAIVTDVDNNIAMKIGGYFNQSNYAFVYYSKNNNTIAIIIPDVYAYKSGTYSCVIEYTKTTD